MKHTLPLALLLACASAWADSSPIDCTAPKKPAPVLKKRKPAAKAMPVPLKALASEELCPAPVAPKSEPTPGPTAVAVDDPVPTGAIGDGPTFVGIAAASPEEFAAPVQHITYVHDLVPGGILPVPVYITNTTHEVQTVYVDRPGPTVEIPPSFDPPSAGVPVSPVPEPETWAMMAAGLAALVLVKRRAKA